MSLIGTVYEDVTTDVMGEIGSWQWLITFVSAALMVSTMFNQYEDTFLLHSSQVYCISPRVFETDNSSVCFLAVKGNSSEGVKCSKWNLQLLWFIWLKKKWLVFCADEFKLLSTAIVSRFGLVFGCIIFGLLSDSFGRKKAIIVDVLAELIFGLVITFCDSESWFSLVAFLKSLFSSANFYMGIILVCEVSSNKWRSWLCVIAMTPRLLRMICMIPLANSAPNTETYSFIACFYSCLCLILIRWSPESPQWLLYNRKIAVAEKILVKASKTNGIKLCSNFKIRPVNHKAYESLNETTTCLGVITTHNIRAIFLTATIFWILYYFLWSSLYVRIYSEKNVSYLLLKVLCFLAVLACLTIFSSVKLTLRYLLLAHILMTGVLTAGVMFFRQVVICNFLAVLACLTIFSSVKLTLRYLLLAHILMTGVLTAGVMFFRQGTTHAFISSVALASGLLGHALILNITPRLFAINIRATTFGCCHATGQLGSIISYLLFLFRPINEITFMTVELVVTIILAGLCFIIPDVDRRELPDILSDMDYFSELSKPLRWATQKTNSASHEEFQIRVYSFDSARRSLSQTYSDDRLPAQRIGCIRIWRLLINYISKKFNKRTT